ncbi:MAG: YihY/virulence factor BrkB family protein [Candidatus Marinimicrobia bacterium]|nr:YihY/virulence factor BrkB family protein [Candidatus Neomarinimicrobiota bacterium]
MKTINKETKEAIITEKKTNPERKFKRKASHILNEKLKIFSIDSQKRFRYLIHFTFKKFSDDSCFERASSLAYITIISLIPLLVLFFSVVSILGLYKEMISYIHETLLPFVVPEFQDQLIEIITDYISPTAFTGQGSGIINLLAIVGLILSATGVLIMAERIFNQIWRVKETRSYVQKITAFWVILTTSPFLILASVYLADYFGPTDEWINQVSGHFALFKILYDQFVVLLVSFIAFSLLLIFTPSIRVKYRAAAIGGLVSAILWEISKKGFYFYIINIGTVTNFYKQIATLPLFLLWVFLTWIIILFGAEVSYTYQNLSILIREQKDRRRGKKHSMGYLATSLLYAILRSYKKGQSIPNLDTIANTIGIRIEELNNVAATLVEMEILMEDAAQAGRFTLIKSEEKLDLHQIIMEMRMREFPSEAILAVETPEKIHLTEDTEIKECVEYIFSHAESSYLNTFSKEIDFSYYQRKLK